MQFANPKILYFLFALIAPIIIHLFNFRRYKKVYFSNVKMLKVVIERNKKASELYKLLVLAMRLLTLSALIFAFAQPYIPNNKSEKITTETVASIFIDNSFSMETSGNYGNLIEEAKNKAAEIVSAYPNDVKFQILTNDFEGKSQRLYNSDDAKILIDEITPTSKFKTLKQIINRQDELMSNYFAATKYSYIISDFQKSTIISSLPDSSTLNKIFLIPIESETIANISIDTCWFESPILQLNKNATLKVKIQNYGANNIEKLPISLKINNNQEAVSVIDIPAHNYNIAELSFRNKSEGVKKAIVEISDSPITFDNKWYMIFNISKNIPILSIFENINNKHIETAFNTDSVFTFTKSNIRHVDFSMLNNYKLIILDKIEHLSSGANELISNYLNNGGTIIAIPSEHNIEAINNFLVFNNSPTLSQKDTTKIRISHIDKENNIFKDIFDNSAQSEGNIDYPSFAWHYKLQQTHLSNAELLMNFSNGDGFLYHFPVSKGSIYLFTNTADESSGIWTNHPIFAPIILSLGFNSNKQLPINYTIGQNTDIEIVTNKTIKDNVFTIIKDDNSYSFIPYHKKVDNRTYICLQDNIYNAGFYSIYNDKLLINYIALNYNHYESNLKKITSDNIKDILQLENIEVLKSGKNIPLKSQINELSNGKQLWSLFLIFALIFIAFEILFLRMISNNKTSK